MIEDHLKDQDQPLVSGSDHQHGTGEMPSLRVYFCVERLNIIMQQDRVQATEDSILIEKEDVM